MTLNQLTYFYEAAKLQHFNQAAEKLHISEPSLSRSIGALESELGVVLFEKTGRNVVLTKTGDIFFEHVDKILREVNQCDRKMHQLSGTGGHIDLAYVAPLAGSFIPNMCRAFLLEEKNQNVTFNFHQDITSKNIEGLKAGNYDIIFGSFVKDEPNINFIPIMQQELVVIIPKGHPLEEQALIEARAFGEYPVLGYTRTSGLGRLTRDFFTQNDVEPNFICESPDENGIASLVAANFGIALVADVQSIHRDDVTIRKLSTEQYLSHTVYMAYIKGRYQMPAVKRMIDFILVHSMH
ncbi:MAG: LysR family transcriptional regulator [Pseudobutyrivibrio sp.]|nr:LysR family transcriptional regulator [Pseudobutyrivibrio sp.]